jgi:hypothetical protein
MFNIRPDGFEAVRAVGKARALDNAIPGKGPAQELAPTGQPFGAMDAGIDRLVHAQQQDQPSQSANQPMGANGL